MCGQAEDVIAKPWTATESGCYYSRYQSSTGDGM